MEDIFFIVAALFLTVTIWEYFSGKVFDIGFTKFLTIRSDTQSKFFKILAVQFAAWIFLLALLILAYAVIVGTRDVELRRIRSYIMLVFILIIFPFFFVRKWFAGWVMNTMAGKRKK